VLLAVYEPVVMQLLDSEVEIEPYFNLSENIYCGWREEFL